MRIVGVFERDGPAAAERVRDLAADLLVGEVGEKLERALRDAHVDPQYDGVTATSGVSVEA